MRTGARMGDTKLIDTMVATLTDPFGVGHMGITAENLVTKWGITREEQDQLAVDSHRKAAAAIAEGRFKSQIVPIVKQTRKGEVVFDTDEHVKANTTMETLAKMKPAFKKDGSVTAGNARASTTARPSSCWPTPPWPPPPATSRWRAWSAMPWPVCPTT
jgi:acetyl-CoA C-acetyltransferase